MGPNLLIPLDGSELAEAAVEYAARIGKALGWGAVLLNVIPREGEHHLFMPTTPVVEASAPVWEAAERVQQRSDEALQHEEDAAIDAMSGAAQRLAQAGVPVHREALVGNPRDVIVRRAAADDIAMIVMASHGRTGLARLFRGSVADGVVGHTHRPVLVVHPFHKPDDRLAFEHEQALDGDHLQQIRAALQTA